MRRRQTPQHDPCRNRRFRHFCHLHYNLRSHLAVEFPVKNISLNTYENISGIALKSPLDLSHFADLSQKVKDFFESKDFQLF